jgi:hypothetical protein
MSINKLRFKKAAKAMVWHFVGSLLVALIVGVLVFGVWFPYPFRQLSGGTELFLLIMVVDLVCGPLLTFVLYNPVKPKRELILDLSLVVVLQLAALSYGVWTLHVSRPLYLVCEFDRFKVIALVDVELPELDKLPEILQRQLFKGPQIVGLRDGSKAEREKVMFESVQGGRDYGERPGFYVAYDGAKAYQKARPISDFIRKHPDRQDDLSKLTGSSAAQAANQWRYLPIIARQDWVAVLNAQGEIVGYLKGDGF